MSDASLDIWMYVDRLDQDHRRIKKKLEEIQKAVQFYQRNLELERKRRAEVETALKGGIKQLKQDYQRLRPKLDKVKERIYLLLLKYPGLTYREIPKKYVEEYHHEATCGNRVRELFKEGRVVKVKGPDGLLHWYPRIKEE